MRTNLPKLEKRHDRYLGNSRLVELGERINRIHRYGAVTKDPAIPSVIEDVFEKARHYQVGVDSTGTPRYCDNFINDYYDDEGWWALAWSRPPN